jgi:hypothetical protein
MIDFLYSVLVNWNLKDDTLACVESLLAAGAIPGQVVVVDNGSTDGSPQALHERFGSAVHVIESGQNLGFGGGANLGIRYALDRGAQWIFLLNNDTVVAPTLFAAFQQVNTAATGFSILAPLILYHDAPDKIWYLGDRLVPTSLITYSLQRDRKDRGQLPALASVDFVCSCGMLIKRDVFATIGLLDPRFFMYADEVDFCWRARSRISSGLRHTSQDVAQSFDERQPRPADNTLFAHTQPNLVLPALCALVSEATALRIYSGARAAHCVGRSITRTANADSTPGSRLGRRLDGARLFVSHFSATGGDAAVISPMIPQDLVGD